MPRYLLRLLEDTLPPSTEPVFLPAVNRACSVMTGSVTVETATASSLQRTESVWIGHEAVTYLTGNEGSRILRWELAAVSEAHDGRLRSAPKATSTVKLASEIELDAAHAWLMRCDSVSFPKGGEALLHVHQGPGIRCTVHGEILIRSNGHEERYPAGAAWLEHGVDAPVYARASANEETMFIRCMLLPRSLKGRSSVRYVRREDDDRPKSQRYQIYGERFVELP